MTNYRQVLSADEHTPVLANGALVCAATGSEWPCWVVALLAVLQSEAA